MFDNQVNDVPFEEQQAQAEGQNVETTVTEASESVSEVVPSPEAEATGQGGKNAEGQDTQPEWQSEFSSAEEMYNAYKGTKKSYDHIRPKLTKTTQQLAELKRNSKAPQHEVNNNVPQAQDVQPVQQVAQGQPQQQVYTSQKSAEDIVKDFIAESTRPLADQMNNMLLDQEISNVANKYDDFAEYGDKIVATMENNPAMWDMPDAVENAYKLAKFDAIGDTIDKAIQEATTKAYADKQKKVLGSGNTAKPSSPELEPQGKSPEQEIGDSIVNAVPRRNSIFL